MITLCTLSGDYIVQLVRVKFGSHDLQVDFNILRQKRISIILCNNTSFFPEQCTHNMAGRTFLLKGLCASQPVKIDNFMHYAMNECYVFDVIQYHFSCTHTNLYCNFLFVIWNVFDRFFLLLAHSSNGSLYNTFKYLNYDMVPD